MGLTWVMKCDILNSVVKLEIKIKKKIQYMPYMCPIEQMLLFYPTQFRFTPVLCNA